MEDYQKNLAEAMRNIQIADHMTYLTYPLINEKRILLKIFDEILKGINNCMRAVLSYESRFGETLVYDDDEVNMQSFINRFSKIYNLDDVQLKKMTEIFELGKKHKQSAMEFVRKNKMVILSDDLATKTLDIIKIKDYLRFAKELLMRTNMKISGDQDGFVK